LNIRAFVPEEMFGGNNTDATTWLYNDPLHEVG